MKEILLQPFFSLRIKHYCIKMSTNYRYTILIMRLVMTSSYVKHLQFTQQFCISNSHSHPESKRHSYKDTLWST